MTEKDGFQSVAEMKYGKSPTPGPELKRGSDILLGPWGLGEKFLECKTKLLVRVRH